MEVKKDKELINEILIEEYRSRKQEISSSLNHQYGILTMVVAATSAVMALISNRPQLAVVSIGLVLPGTYAFLEPFGWMLYTGNEDPAFIYIKLKNCSD